MPRSPRPTGFLNHLPDPWVPVLAPARGPTAVATYLRVHLYGAAVGRSLLDRCISAVGPGDRERLVPLRAEFEQEIAVASRLLADLSVLGTPGRRLLRLSSGLGLSALPVGPLLTDPLPIMEPPEELLDRVGPAGRAVHGRPRIGPVFEEPVRPGGAGHRAACDGRRGRPPVGWGPR